MLFILVRLLVNTKLLVVTFSGSQVTWRFSIVSLPPPQYSKVKCIIITVIVVLFIYTCVLFLLDLFEVRRGLYLLMESQVSLVYAVLTRGSYRRVNKCFGKKNMIYCHNWSIGSQSILSRERSCCANKGSTSLRPSPRRHQKKKGSEG